MHNNVGRKRLAIDEGGLKILFKALAWFMISYLFPALMFLPPSWMLYYGAYRNRNNFFITCIVSEARDMNIREVRVVNTTEIAVICRVIIPEPLWVINSPIHAIMPAALAAALMFTTI